MKGITKGGLCGVAGVCGRVLPSLVCPAFFAGAFGLPRSFATLVGVGGADSVAGVSGTLPVPTTRLGLPIFVVFGRTYWTKQTSIFPEFFSILTPKCPFFFLTYTYIVGYNIGRK